MSANDRLGAVIAALMVLIIFVGVPYMLPQYLPPDIAHLLTRSGLDLQSFINQMMVLGAVMAALILVKGFVGRASPLSLVIRVALDLSGFALTVVLLGAGDVASLGVTTFTLTVENTTSRIATDFRVFVYFMVIVAVLRVVQSYLDWSDARAYAMRPGRIPP